MFMGVSFALFAQAQGHGRISSHWSYKGVSHFMYKIGELANLSGLPIKTIRFYSDIGVLPPTGTTESRHRLYTDHERAQLETIRSLREVGMDLETIKQLLHGTSTPVEALRLQLEAVELNLRSLRRQRTLLKTALDRDGAEAMVFLQAARSHSALSAGERQHFLNTHIDQLFSGVSADPEWLERIWRSDLLELPEQLNEAQFEAWLELAALVTDPGFTEHYNRVGREFWGQIGSAKARSTFAQALNSHNKATVQAITSGWKPHLQKSQRLIQQYLEIHAKAFKARTSRAFALRLLKTIEQNTDPRGERFWELVALIKGFPKPTVSMRTMHDWRVQALTTFANSHLKKPMRE
jgi:DNA-binding transcriptional MerR regulator